MTGHGFGPGGRYLLLEHDLVMFLRMINVRGKRSRNRISAEDTRLNNLCKNLGSIFSEKILHIEVAIYRETYVKPDGIGATCHLQDKGT